MELQQEFTSDMSADQKGTPPSSFQDQNPRSKTSLGSYFFIPAWIFAIVGVIFLCSIVFSLLDNALDICSWGGGDLGFSEARCPAIFVWYPILNGFLSVVILVMMFGGVFIIVPAFLLLYFFAIRQLNKGAGVIAADAWISDENLRRRRLRRIKILKILLIISPLFLISSFFAEQWRGQNWRHNKVIADEKTRIDQEQKFEKALKENPDFCKDVSTWADINNLYIDVPQNGVTDLTLHFPVGYWKGVGTAYVSRENYWNGVDQDEKMEFHVEAQYPGVVDFSSEVSLKIQNNIYLGKFGRGKRYDIRVFTLKDKNLRESRPGDRFNFSHGVFQDYTANTKFSVNDSKLVVQESCITVVSHM